MSNVGSMKQFAQQLADAVAALEREEDATTAADQAERRLKDAQEKHAGVLQEIARAKMDADAHHEARIAEIAAVENKSAQALREHKRKLDAADETAKRQIEETSIVREKLNSEIGELKQKRDELNAEVAQLRAKVSDLAASI